MPVEIPIAEARFKCACGKYTGSQQGLRGHQRHAKSPLCKQPYVLVLPDGALPPTGAELPVEPLEPPPDVWEGWDTRLPGSVVEGESGRRERDEGMRVESNGSGPTMIGERLVLPATLRPLYDAWVSYFHFEGTFAEWLAQLAEHYCELAGVQLTIQVAVPPELKPELQLNGGPR